MLIVKVDEHKFSKGLESEIDYQINGVDYEDAADIPSRAQALHKLADDSDFPDSAAHEFRAEINDFLISIGVYKEMTAWDLAHTIVSRGQVWDLKRHGKFYKFESWKPLDPASEN